jgi:D-inositol-3-phosphate glycosyltransferase
VVRKRMPNATLVVAGPIDQFGSDVHGAEETSWARRIGDVGGVYLGAVHEARLAGIYNMAEVFVMPTRELEMFGMAAVEAQACGIPVVASDHGGLRETVPTSCGSRFPLGDAAALADQIHRLLEDHDLRDRCSAAAVENARRYSWDRIALELDAHYAKVGIHG